jgi:hypothetical protein
MKRQTIIVIIAPEKELENIGYNLKVIRRRSHAKYLRTYYSLQNK